MISNKVNDGAFMMYLSETLKKTDTKIFKKLAMICAATFALIAVNFSFAAPADSVKVVAKSEEIGAATIYSVSFNVSKPIPSKAVIKVTFPAEFDISNLQVAGSTTINGGFEQRVSNRTLSLERSGLGREIKPNEKVDVKFAIVKNPTQPKNDYNFDVEILNESQQSLIKSQQKVKIIPKQE